MSEELATEIYEAITGFCREGDVYAQKGEIESAISKYEQALALVPGPLAKWEASTWILAALGDMFFWKQEYERARIAFLQAINCPGGLGNPFLHLRMGQIQFELENYVLAGDELTRAYMGEGRELFLDEDPKYFELLKRILKEPPGGW